MDETYIKVKGKWTYYYRAVDKHGKTFDFMLSEHRDEAAATAFFTRAIGNNGFPTKVVIDKSGANMAGLQSMNCLLDFERMVLVDRSLAGQISEQHHRAGPSLHQEVDAANERLQIFKFRRGNAGRHRSCTHDPQTAVRSLRSIRIPTICGTRGINVSSLVDSFRQQTNFATEPSVLMSILIRSAISCVLSGEAVIFWAGRKSTSRKAAPPSMHQKFGLF
jgi:hypothetical protein